MVRPNQDFRGYAGQIAGGSVSTGDKVKILPSGKEALIETIMIGAAPVSYAAIGQSVTMTIDRNLDISRGDVIVGVDQPPETADQLRANIIWMQEAEMLPGRRYIFKTECRSAAVTMAKLRYRINMNTYERQPSDKLALNDIGACDISLDRPISFDPYQENRVGDLSF